ncbi:hypothetical protein GCM10007913_42730 [Devosia yakushimensis]|uniref:Uncharacterized protein n=1 Tax=Devosia yakushimensis TaxID=470028 RepID=A0ABQ5UME3_9HYPH|nr:hypothetical protein GCM10007913_42730 [Devosia yakushimensis]
MGLLAAIAGFAQYRPDASGGSPGQPGMAGPALHFYVDQLKSHTGPEWSPHGNANIGWFTAR